MPLVIVATENADLEHALPLSCWCVPWQSARSENVAGGCATETG